LGRFKEIADFIGYETTYAMAEFSELAKQTDTHIALLHHIPRGRNDDADTASAGFGSIAIAGGCNARFVCVKKPGGIYIVASSKGKGGGFRPFDGEIVLDRDETTHWVTARGPYSWQAQADAVRPSVFAFIQGVNDWVDAAMIAKGVGIQRSIAGAAAKALAYDGKVKVSIGKYEKHFWGRLDLSDPLWKRG
jgi:hypothetical protein